MSRSCEPIGFDDSKSYVQFGLITAGLVAVFATGVYADIPTLCGIAGFGLIVMALAFVAVHWEIVRDLGGMILIFGGLVYGVWQCIEFLPTLGRYFMQGFQ